MVVWSKCYTGEKIPIHQICYTTVYAYQLSKNCGNDQVGLEIHGAVKQFNTNFTIFYFILFL